MEVRGLDVVKGREERGQKAMGWGWRQKGGGERCPWGGPEEGTGVLIAFLGEEREGDGARIIPSAP